MIYVDPCYQFGKLSWCHMATDGDLSELHEMADTIGLKRKWFQDHNRVPHYDLSPKKRQLSIQAGALPVSAKDLFAKCRKATK